ncbi:MAG: 6-phosphogluconate dehydrogenase (decarboxylating) [Candidatus Magasanikbacteria bacterium RIFCSPHIGHO2_02_FULL_51_14]|uniref:6-phosphogluconate dehydrogenase (Decarboxylating) n=1 Tax=Candidatus Magasanikbacteria bacterium RIFCSPHIGHO2_02_FULL_51_14 TaxID=1798683 RepID=A0A1F6MQQ6_9BACT|nr:MAG: 6-phosphogluconate dehydrogenase (decarboxylating) [Candidatus Magasanikbacteria bacterium RIFCSPHIGHO2_02_FULL_51_14]
MGIAIARRLMDFGWTVHGYDISATITKKMTSENVIGAYSIPQLAEQLPRPRILWLMVPSGKPVDDILFDTKNGLASILSKGDVVIDGGNSFYKDSIRRAKKLKKRGILFLDCGVSGGPAGTRNGASLMVGGDKKTFDRVEPLFRDLAQEQGYQFFAGVGAGHFVKMIHNGIEYGMMQAIAEGFDILKKSAYKLDLSRVADVYNHGSVIESRLVGWLKDAFELHGENLTSISGSSAQTGEGAWTANTAKELDVRAKVIGEAVRFRRYSQEHPSYAGKIVSALRGQFGGHSVTKK